MATDPSPDEPPFPSSGGPPGAEPDFDRVRRRIRRRHRLFLAGLLTGLSALAVLVALSHAAKVQGVLLIVQALLLLALVAWRQQSGRDADAIACGVGETVVQRVRRRRLVLGLCLVVGCLAGVILAWLAKGR